MIQAALFITWLATGYATWRLAKKRLQPSAVLVRKSKYWIPLLFLIGGIVLLGGLAGLSQTVYTQPKVTPMGWICVLFLGAIFVACQTLAAVLAIFRLELMAGTPRE